MKKYKPSKRMGILSSKNKWAKSGRNLAHFLMSFAFYFFAYIFWGIAAAFKWFFSLIFSRRKKPRTGKITPKVAKTIVQNNCSLPDRASRLRVLLEQLEGKLIQDNLNVGKIIDLTDGCSEADLAMIVSRAAKKALLRKKGDEISPISKNDLEESIEEFRSHRNF